MREQELKRVVAEDFVLRPNELIVPGAASVGPRTRRIHDVYFDTDDVRLARWGVTLRWRDGEGCDAGWAKQLRRELRWLADELSTVRDGDVLAAHLAVALDANPEIRRDGGAEILSHLARERDMRRDTLLPHLADRRAIELFDHLVDAANSPRLRKPAQQRRAVKALPPLVRAAWRSLRSAVDDLGTPPTDVELHQIRILAKRARYATESVTPAAGKPARKFAKAAASLQDTLGELHDSAIATDWLEHTASTQLSGRGAFAAGRLAQQLRTQAANGRDEWRPSYERMRTRASWVNSRA
ncbi:MAG: CHAD domain-containing protein [Acidimicrobiales bacterium]